MCVPGGCLPTHMIGMAVLQVMLSSVDHIVEALQLVFQQADSLRPRLLRFSQRGGDVLPDRCRSWEVAPTARQGI